MAVGTVKLPLFGSLQLLTPDYSPYGVYTAELSLPSEADQKRSDLASLSILDQARLGPDGDVFLNGQRLLTNQGTLASLSKEFRGLTSQAYQRALYSGTLAQFKALVSLTNRDLHAYLKTLTDGLHPSVTLPRTDEQQPLRAQWESERPHFTWLGEADQTFRPNLPHPPKVAVDAPRLYILPLKDKASINTSFTPS